MKTEKLFKRIVVAGLLLILELSKLSMVVYAEEMALPASSTSNDTSQSTSPKSTDNQQEEELNFIILPASILFEDETYMYSSSVTFDISVTPESLLEVLSKEIDDVSNENSTKEANDESGDNPNDETNDDSNVNSTEETNGDSNVNSTEGNGEEENNDALEQKEELKIYKVYLKVSRDADFSEKDITEYVMKKLDSEIEEDLKDDSEEQNEDLLNNPDNPNEDLFTLTEEGKYEISLSVDYYFDYADKSDETENNDGNINENENTGNSSGTEETEDLEYKTISFEKKVLIDKSAPEISYSFEDGETGYYFNHLRTLRFNVADSFSEVSEAYAYEGENLIKVFDKEECKGDCLISFESDGTFSGEILTKDILGNEASVSFDEFCIDTKAPHIKVSIDNPDNEYTNAKRYAHFTVEDPNLLTESEGTYEFKEGKDRIEIYAKDKAGNESSYISNYFVQDYSAPEVEIFGIEDEEVTNSDISFSIDAIDSNLDKKQSFIVISGVKNGVTDDYYMETSNGRAYFVVDNLKDDIYSLMYRFTDLAGNSISDEMSFVINRNGSKFSLSDNLCNSLGRIKEELKNVFITEENLSQIDKSNVRFLVTRDGRLLDVAEGTDYYIEEKYDNGYIYTYFFNDDLFKYDGVYTLSLLTKDEAGNTNDTRFSDKCNDIRFGIQSKDTSIITLPTEKTDNENPEGKETSYGLVKGATLISENNQEESSDESIKTASGDLQIKKPDNELKEKDNEEAISNDNQAGQSTDNTDDADKTPTEKKDFLHSGILVPTFLGKVIKTGKWVLAIGTIVLAIVLIMIKISKKR